MMFGGNGGIVWAERTIPSGMAGLAIATVPLWMAAIDRVVLGHRQPRVVVIGLAVGFVGAALLVGGNALEGEIDMGGLVLALAAAASWAAGSIYQRHARAARPAARRRRHGDAGRRRVLLRGGRARGRVRGHRHRVGLACVA